MCACFQKWKDNVHDSVNLIFKLKVFQEIFLEFSKNEYKTYTCICTCSKQSLHIQPAFCVKKQSIHGLWNSGIFCCITFTIIQYHGLIQFSITFCISIKLLYQNHRLRIGTFGIPTIPVLIIYYIKELNGVVLNVERTKMENGQEQPKTDMTTTKQNEVIFYKQCKQWNQYWKKNLWSIYNQTESFNIL